MLACIVIKILHVIYITVTYFVIPYLFTDNKTAQIVNIINIFLLIVHWKLLNNQCILDIVEKHICPRKIYDINNSLFGIDDLTFSNLVQFLLSSAVLIAFMTIYGQAMDIKTRTLLLCINISIVIFIVPLSVIHKFKL
jgi:hypothetical protein